MALNPNLMDLREQSVILVITMKRGITDQAHRMDGVVVSAADPATVKSADAAATAVNVITVTAAVSATDTMSRRRPTVTAANVVAAVVRCRTVVVEAAAAVLAGIISHPAVDHPDTRFGKVKIHQV